MISTSSNNTVDALNNLLKVLMETEQNYLECINQIFHRGVRTFFVTQAHTKNKFVHQLALEIQQIGGELYVFDASLVQHFPFYEDLRTVSFEKVLDDCIALEREMIATYEKIMEIDELQETTSYLLLKQKTELEGLLSEENVQNYRTHERLVS